MTTLNSLLEAKHDNAVRYCVVQTKTISQVKQNIFCRLKLEIAGVYEENPIYIDISFNYAKKKKL